MPKPLPSREYLLTVLDYDAATGVLKWRHRPDVPEFINRRDAGKVAGSSGSGGRRISLLVDGKSVRYRVNRVIWKMAFDAEPPEVDHRNGDFDDNRLSNLRAATHAQNMHNMKRQRAGLKGVVFHKPTGRWQAKIMVNGKAISLRYHDTEAEAHAAYMAAAKRLHGEFARAD